MFMHIHGAARGLRATIKRESFVSSCLVLLVIGVLPRKAGADCPAIGPTTDPETLRIEGPVVTEFTTRNASVATDFEGKFIVAFETTAPMPTIPNDVYVQRFEADGTCFCRQPPPPEQADECPTRLNDSTTNPHRHPSVAMNWNEDTDNKGVFLGSGFQVAFLIDPVQLNKPPADINVRYWHHHFEAPGFTSPNIVNLLQEFDDWFPSAGMGASEMGRIYGSKSRIPAGLRLELQMDLELGPPFPETVVQIEPCATDPLCEGGWTPVIWMRDNGDSAIAYANVEDPANPPSPTDIRLHVYDSNGTEKGSDILVSEDPLTPQSSPAVAMDDAGNIVVTWVGFRSVAPGEKVIYAKRFCFDGATVHEASVPFIVNSTDNSDYEIPTDANPTVAIRNSNDPDKQGEFLIAWNAREARSDNRRVGVVRGQYFDNTGEPFCDEFQVHVQTSPNFTPVPENAFECHLGASAQHTADYGPDGTVVVVWTRTNMAGSQNQTVHFTILPPAQRLGACCRGIDATCVITTEEDCQGPCDVFLGACVECPKEGCSLVELGACCRGIDATCVITTEEDCQGPCDFFFGDCVECPGEYCFSAGFGACCLPNGDCIYTQECACDDMGGTFTYNVDCGDGCGACCYTPSGSCTLAPRTACTDVCEVFKGEGTNCIQCFTGVEGPKPCCLPDDTCQMRFACECAAQGGTMKQGLNCVFVTCP